MSTRHNPDMGTEFVRDTPNFIWVRPDLALTESEFFSLRFGDGGASLMRSEVFSLRFGDAVPDGDGNWGCRCGGGSRGEKKRENGKESFDFRHFPLVFNFYYFTFINLHFDPQHLLSV